MALPSTSPAGDSELYKRENRKVGVGRKCKGRVGIIHGRVGASSDGEGMPDWLCADSPQLGSIAPRNRRSVGNDTRQFLSPPGERRAVRFPAES